MLPCRFPVRSGLFVALLSTPAMLEVRAGRMASCSAISTCWPRPVRVRWNSAASTPESMWAPATKSTTEGPVRTGAPSANPVVLMMAVRAWMVRSMAGSPA